MNLTVTQRILGGFALLVILLLVISGTSFRSLSAVDKQLSITTERITPIILRSSAMAVSLLSANKAVLLYLDTDDTAELAKQQKLFKQQQQQYSAQRDQLLELGQNYPQVLDAVADLDAKVAKYFANASKALTTHQTNLALTSVMDQAVLALRNEIHFFSQDIELLITYGISEAEKSSGRELKENLKAVEGEFNTLLNTTTAEEITPIEESFATEGYGFSLLGMKTRLQKLIDSGNETAADLKKFMDAIELAATDPAGVMQLHKQKVQLQSDIDTLLIQLAKSTDNSGVALDMLMVDAQALAETVKAEAKAEVSFSKLLNIAISVFSVLVAITIGIWVSRNIKGSLNKVMSILKVIADGDLSQRLPITSKDEFGQLSTWVNSLAEKQEGVIREIHDAADQISDSAKQASSISSRTQQMMDDQQQQTTQVATAIHQMSTTVAEVAQSAELAQQQVTDIDNSANHNRELMELNIDRVNKLAEEIERSATVINQLSDDSDNIGRILEVIQEIAGQTNLLALNAAIEAARAGEQGRGFAVVADEVRTLASRTQNSTKEIQSMIEKLQSGAKNAVKIMDISRTEARSSVAQTTEAGNSLSEMVNQLGDVRQMSVNIATAAEQQTAVSLEISKNVQAIASNAELGAEDANLSAQGGELLSDLALKQQQMINQFTLGK